MKIILLCPGHTYLVYFLVKITTSVGFVGLFSFCLVQASRVLPYCKMKKEKNVHLFLENSVERCGDGMHLSPASPSLDSRLAAVCGLILLFLPVLQKVCL